MSRMSFADSYAGTARIAAPGRRTTYSPPAPRRSDTVGSASARWYVGGARPAARRARRSTSASPRNKKLAACSSPFRRRKSALARLVAHLIRCRAARGLRRECRRRRSARIARVMARPDRRIDRVIQDFVAADAGPRSDSSTSGGDGAMNGSRSRRSFAPPRMPPWSGRSTATSVTERAPAPR